MRSMVEGAVTGTAVYRPCRIALPPPPPAPPVPPPAIAVEDPSLIACAQHPPRVRTTP